MNHIDYIITTSTPRVAAHDFTDRVMSAIEPQRHNWWQPVQLHYRVAMWALIAVAASTIAFSGYAYAIGSDPITLIQRIMHGNSVTVLYGDRTFSHGKKLTYSDAAITAQAELSLTDKAHFHAASMLTIPTNSVEYVDNPTIPAAQRYIYPTLAYLTRHGATVSVREFYLRGDKTNLARKIEVNSEISADQLRYFTELHANVLQDGQPVLVAYYRDNFLEHAIGAGSAATPTTINFAFRLTHAQQDYLEADKAMQDPNFTQHYQDAQLQPLVEENFGAINNRCINNGADTCRMLAGNEGQSLYGYILGADSTTYLTANPHTIAQGEAVADGADTRNDVIMRTIEGRISVINESSITVTTSSGARWTLSYDASQRSQFAARFKTSLRTGDTLQAIIYQPITELDSRTISDQFIYQITRIQ